MALPVPEKKGGGDDAPPPVFQTPDNGPFLTIFYTPTRHPSLPRAQHGADQHERTAWTSACRFRSRSSRRCFTSSARRSARRSRSRLRACSIAVAVACPSRNRRCSCSHISSIIRKRPCRCCCCCSSCCCCSGCCCSSCFFCCCTHPTETPKCSTTTVKKNKPGRSLRFPGVLMAFLPALPNRFN